MSEQNPTPEGEPNPQQPSVEQPDVEQPFAQPEVQPYSQPYGQPYEQPYGQYPQPGYPQAAYSQPGYPQPGYAQPGYPAAYPAYGYAVARPTNTLAVVALISSLVGIFIIPILGSIAAVITAPMARKQIRETGEGGDGMALSGMIIGWVGLAIWLLVGLFILIPVLFFTAAVGTSTY